MILWCPDGALLHPVYPVCMTNQYAIGPFPQDMKKACENFRGIGSADCAEENWDIYFAGALRGVARCAPGSVFNSTLDACSDQDYGYGPFKEDQVQQCKSLQWGFVCESMRWPLDVLRGKKAPPAPAPNIVGPGNIPWTPANLRGVAGKLLSFYSNPTNYKSVYSQVMSWFGTTQNGCVAFISTALRNVGVPVPKALNGKGYNISTWTAALSEYLEQNLGWRRVSNLRDLAPGDVAFTLDLDGSRGIPAHVFMFVGWIDDTSSLARVIDNQGFLHTRDLLGYKGNFTPFQYALRPPG